MSASESARDATASQVADPPAGPTAVAPAPVFISYSRSDYHFAESLAFHLLRQGLPAWLDVRDLTPGVDWERHLMQTIEQASVVLLVATPVALRSPHVCMEWCQALAHGRRIVVLHWFRRISLPPELAHLVQR